MGKRYGTKAAYDAERQAHRKATSMTDDDRDRLRDRERAREMRPVVWTLVFAAGINGSGKNAQGATQYADQALEAFDSRFVTAPPEAD